MCELLGLTSGRPVRPSAALAAFRSRGGQDADNADGWGIAYLADGVFRLEKAPEAAATSTRFAQLAATVDSALIVAHVRKARHPPVPGMLNTHPFTHACCGREWVFAHNGMVPEVMEHAPQQVVCKPAGDRLRRTFCHLLGAIASCYEAARRPDGAPRAMAGSISLGKFNFAVDGVSWSPMDTTGRPRGCRRSATSRWCDQPLTAEVVAFAESLVYRAGRLTRGCWRRRDPGPPARGGGAETAYRLIQLAHRSTSVEDSAK
jgi:glutamine amidotransferase